VKQSSVSPQKEFDYTTEKISSNFSNFSSWHYRSKLLPVLHPDTASCVGVDEKVVLEGLEVCIIIRFSFNECSSYNVNAYL
jgi:geranylgeranyl transferase type-2 subunit alpha